MTAFGVFPKVKGDLYNYKDWNTVLKLGGDGSDSAKTVSSSENITRGAVYNWTSLTVDVGQTLGLTGGTAGDLTVFLISGDLTLNGKIDSSGDGFAGGAGSASGGATGGDGTIGTGFDDVLTEHATAGGGAIGSSNAPGGWDASGSGGGGGSSTINSGSAGSLGGSSGGGTRGTVGSAGARYSKLLTYLRNLNCVPFSGTGGGGGGGSATADSSSGTGTGGAGGAGGGSILIMVAGNVTFGASSELDCSGIVGTAGGNGEGGEDGGGGGGGGGAGSIYIFYSITETDGGVTKTKGGGGGGAGGTGDRSGGAGGAGGDGLILVQKTNDVTIE